MLLLLAQLFFSLIGIILLIVLSPFLLIGLVLRCVCPAPTKGSDMKAAIHNYKAPSGIVVTTKAKPKSSKCPKGFVIVKVMAAGTNPVDAKAVFGDKFAESLMGFWHWVFTGKTCGFDYAGIVDYAPAGSKYKVGDEVFGLNYQYPPSGLGTYGGTYAEFIMVPVDQLWYKPQDLSFIGASVLPLVGVTCLQSFEQHGLPVKVPDSSGPKLKVLVIGASGGVGHVITQVASAFELEVTGVCGTSNVEFVKKCGASAVIDYREGDPIEQLEAFVEKNGAFDICFDTVSSADSRDKANNYYFRISASKTILKKPGADKVDSHNYIVFGGRTFDWFSAAVKRFLKINIFKPGFELFWIKMPGSFNHLETLADLSKDGKLTPKVQEVKEFSSEGVQAAFRALNPPKGESRAVSGKIAIEIVPNDV